ncbi:MAG: hypothetical protein KR126chlam3_01273 [Chlamydiae bacterium]|nr:hypothetical protein [Chlamydiota bacterium]
MTVHSVGTSPNQDLFSPLPLELWLRIAKHLPIREFFRLKGVSREIYFKIKAIELICFRKLVFALVPFCYDLQFEKFLGQFSTRSIEEITKYFERIFIIFVNAITAQLSLSPRPNAKRALHLIEEPLNQSVFGNVRSLDLSNLGLTVLPEHISYLVHLHFLDLSGNQLRFLPPTIGKLKNLFLFYCSQNRLETFPHEMVKRLMDIDF